MFRMLARWFHQERPAAPIDDAERKSREKGALTHDATQLQAQIDPLRKMIERIDDPGFWRSNIR